MSINDSLSRRQFLQKTPLVAAAASAVGTASVPQQANAQAASVLNNSAAAKVSPVRLGFIGVGIRGTLLMEAAAGIAGVEVKAAADCYKGHLVAAQELIKPAPETTGDYKSLISRADIDGIVIATPDHWHLQMTQEALAAGKHVYIEKPMTHRWEEGEAFISAAEKSGKVVQVGSQYLSMGCAQLARDIIKSGRIGQVTLVEGRFHRNTATGAWYYPIPPDASPETVDFKSFLGAATTHEFDLRRFFQWRLFWDYSGGLPTDLFVHLVTATHGVMGVQEPESVVAFGDIYHWKNYREVPDQMSAMVKYPEGFTLQLTSTAQNGHPSSLLTFYGTEGTLEYNGTSCKLFYEPRSEGFSYSTHSWPKATIEQFRQRMNLRDNLSPLDGPAAGEPVEFKSPNDEDSTRAHMRNWVDAIRMGSKPIEDVRFGHHAALVGHMCNLSYRSGKPVKWNKATRKVE